jgi:hypothetical protein
MQRPGLVLGVVFTALAAAAPRDGGTSADCDRHQKPFAVPAESVLATVKTIAVTSPWIEPALSDSARRRGTAAIDSLVQAELRAGGFASVSPAVTDSLWKVIRDSVGGFFDPRTGQADTTKQNAATDALLSGLRERYQVDALLVLQIRIVSADFDKWTVKWDGTHQTFGNLGHHFTNALLHDTYKGRTRALSLIAFVQDLHRRPLYTGRGGLQVYVEPKNGKFVDLPDSVFFADTSRNAAAVHLALCQLVTRPR